MKKYFLILAATVCFAINANAIVWRGTHKVCARNNEATLTLYSSGAMVFYYDYKSYEGKYNIDNGYINLYEDGTKIFSLPYSFNNQTQTLIWVDMGGTKLYNCK